MTDPTTGVVSFSPDSTKDGLKLRLDYQINTNLVQISMVVFALREWTDLTYPLQGVFIDNFNVNVDIDGTINAASSFVAGSPISLPITRSVSAPNYPDVAATSFGHRFCGYNLIGFDRKSLFGASPAVSQIAGFQVSTP